MLSDGERQQIEQLLQRHERKEATRFDALRIIQEQRGWVPDEAICDLATLLDVTAEELDSVATFYSLIFRHPVGRHVIFLCDSVVCWVMGYEAIREHILERLGIALGETTEDDLFTVLTIPCVGACDKAPAMIVDGELYGDLSPERIDAILESYRDGQG